MNKAAFLPAGTLLFLIIRERNSIMAKTKSSVRGKQSKKIVPVKPYVTKDGVKVKGHRRSTPN